MANGNTLTHREKIWRIANKIISNPKIMNSQYGPLIKMGQSQIADLIRSMSETDAKEAIDMIKDLLK